jgi:hypothetical protein
VFSSNENEEGNCGITVIILLLNFSRYFVSVTWIAYPQNSKDTSAYVYVSGEECGDTSISVLLCFESECQFQETRERMNL